MGDPAWGRSLKNALQPGTCVCFFLMSPARDWGYVCGHPKRGCWASLQAMAPPPQQLAHHDLFCQSLVTLWSPGQVSPRAEASEAQGTDDSDSGLRLQKGVEQPVLLRRPAYLHPISQPSQPGSLCVCERAKERIIRLCAHLFSTHLYTIRHAQALSHVFLKLALNRRTLLSLLK